MLLVQPLWKTVWTFLKKLKIELPYDPAILFLDIYLKKMQKRMQKDTCSPMLTALYIYVYGCVCVCICNSIPLHIHIYAMEYYSAIKRMKFCHLQQHEWAWRVLHSVKSQRQKKKNYVTTYMWNLKNKTK